MVYPKVICRKTYLRLAELFRMSNWKQAINHKQYIQQLEFHQKVIDNIAPSLEHLIKAKLVFDKLGLEMIKKVKEFDK